MAEEDELVVHHGKATAVESGSAVSPVGWRRTPLGHGPIARRAAGVPRWLAVLQDNKVLAVNLKAMGSYGGGTVRFCNPTAEGGSSFVVAPR